MNIIYYNEFLVFLDKGLKKNASKSVRLFIESFESEEEKSHWVWSNLAQLNFNNHSRVRHEIYSELIFPVLKKGYLASEVGAMLWLGKLIQNLYQAEHLHIELDYISDSILFKKCYEIEPESKEIRELLLENIVSRLEYNIHEWPSGILCGYDGANLAQCQALRNEVALAKSLDQASQYTMFLNDSIDKMVQYENQLNKFVNKDPQDGA